MALAGSGSAVSTYHESSNRSSRMQPGVQEFSALSSSLEIGSLDESLTSFCTCALHSLQCTRIGFVYASPRWHNKTVFLDLSLRAVACPQVVHHQLTAKVTSSVKQPERISASHSSYLRIIQDTGVRSRERGQGAPHS